jgi:hypothetical protein
VLFAELHGKLSRSYSRVHERAEDLLTSTAFQLLSYVAPKDGLFPSLRRSRRVRWKDGLAKVDGESPGWLADLDRADDYKLRFWPNWGPGVGQPELVLTLFAAKQPLGRLVVEVKLDSGKSLLGNDNDDDDIEGEEAQEPLVRDQLSRYWRQLSKNAMLDNVPALGVIYLTAHAVPPLDALQEALHDESHRIARDDWLGWLSWRDVWAVNVHGKDKPACDLAEILAHKGLKYFDGFHNEEHFLPPKPTGFWRRAWFAPPARWQSPVYQPGFWNRPEEDK